MFRLLAHEVPAARAARGPPVRRGTGNGRPASGSATATWPRSPPTTGTAASAAPTHEAAYDRAASMWLADHLRGKDVLLLAGSNAEAAELSRRVQAKLTQLGTVGPPQAAAVGRQPRRRRRPGPRPPQHRDRRRRPPAHQPRHPPGHRVPRPRRRGPAAAAGRDLDRDVPGPPGLPRRPTPSSPTPATSTSPRAAPSTPPTSWSPTPCPGRPCTSA